MGTEHLTPAQGPARLIAVDWGTSSLRAARLDARGQVLEERASAQGILHVPAGQFATVFEANFGDWMKHGATFSSENPCLTLISGMAGSQQGWVEAPYRACPAGFEELGARLQWVVPGRVAIVPGLSCEHEGIPDVMRGEEVQVFGALQRLGLRDARLVLPGTHSKWVTVQDQQVRHFRTFMTGEVFALLRQHSLLARTLPPLMDGQVQDVFDGPAFDDGVAHALRSASLLHTAFSTRTLALFGRQPANALASYLSGLVIGEELRAQALAPGSDVIIIGSAALQQRYERALAQCQVSARCIGAEATWQGLWALSQTLDRTPS